MFFLSKTAAEKTEADKKTARDTDKTVIKNKKAAAELDTKTKERDRQTVIVTATEAATVTVTVTETNVEMKKTVNSESRKNIRLLTAIQMMLKVLLIFQTSLLHFHADQSDVRQSTFLSHDDIHYYMC